MEKIIISSLVGMAALGYCRIFWNNDKVELKPNFRARVSATTSRIYRRVLKTLRVKAK